MYVYVCIYIYIYIYTHRLYAGAEVDVRHLLRAGKSCRHPGLPATA